MFLKIDITKNIEYDRLTKIIIKKCVKVDSNCIDVGCHKGEILDLILEESREGTQYAFEPIPHLFDNLKKIYIDKKVKVYDIALSDKKGETTFNYVKNAPAYSGIRKRSYAISDPEIEKIIVGTDTLDNLIDTKSAIHLIKIDVEGGEFNVLKGAEEILRKSKPIVIFEFGKGASEYYGTTARSIYDYLVEFIGLNIFTLKSYIKQNDCLNFQLFEQLYESNKEYYFVAAN